MSIPRSCSSAASRAAAELHERGPVDERARLEARCTATPVARALEVLPDGRVKYGLRRAMSDATTAVLMESLDFLAWRAALVPAPARHLLRYHGTMAPNAAWRKLVVPKAPEAERKSCGVEGERSRGVEVGVHRVGGADQEGVREGRAGVSAPWWLTSETSPFRCLRCLWSEDGCGGRWLGVPIRRRLLMEHLT